jgi:hypothetical protein
VTYLADRARRRAPAAPSPGAPLPPLTSSLSPSAAADLEQAELFLLELDAQTQDVGLGRAMYLIGLSEGHLANLIEIIRVMTRGTGAP